MAMSTVWWSMPRKTIRWLTDIEEGHLHVNADIDFPITFSHFTCREPGPSLGPPPDDLFSLIKQSSIKESLQGPPDAFDE